MASLPGEQEGPAGRVGAQLLEPYQALGGGAPSAVRKADSTAQTWIALDGAHLARLRGVRHLFSGRWLASLCDRGRRLERDAAVTLGIRSESRRPPYTRCRKRVGVPAFAKATARSRRSSSGGGGPHAWPAFESRAKGRRPVRRDAASAWGWGPTRSEQWTR